jgi:hypothetical protein
MISETIMSETEETSLKIVSFNILAPCYHKVRVRVSVEVRARVS